MSTMIEKVARASDDCPVWPVKTYRSRLARAAIDAMREPTAGMVQAGLNCDAWAEPDGGSDSILSGTYSAMIDAALSEESTS